MSVSASRIALQAALPKFNDGGRMVNLMIKQKVATAWVRLQRTVQRHFAIAGFLSSLASKVFCPRVSSLSDLPDDGEKLVLFFLFLCVNKCDSFLKIVLCMCAPTTCHRK